MEKKELAALPLARKPREALERINERAPGVCIVRASVHETARGGVLALDVWNKHGRIAAREFFDGCTRAVGLPGGDWNRKLLTNQEGIHTLRWATLREADTVRAFFGIPDDVPVQSCEELICLIEHGRRTDKGFTAKGAFNAGGYDAQDIERAEPPAGWENVMQAHGIGCAHVITARSAWVYIPLEDRKRRMDVCVCSACGAKWNEASGWMVNGSERECPECLGKFRVARYSSKRLMAYEETASLLCFDRVGHTAVARGFEIWYGIDFDGKEMFNATPSNIYAWGPYGNYAYCCYETYAMGHERVYMNKWFEDGKMRDGWATGKRAVVMSPECGALDGTPLANARIEAYAEAFRWVDIVRFATISAKTPALEALCDAGRWGIVRDVCNGKIRLQERERKAHKALGLTKRMYDTLPKFASASYIVAAAVATREGWEPNAEELAMLENVLGHPGGRMMRRAIGARKMIAYLRRAVRYERRRARRVLPTSEAAAVYDAVLTWKDYRDLAERLKVPLDTDDARFPYDVWQRHDRFVAEQNLRNGEETIRKEEVNAAKFQKMWERIAWADWSHGEFCIIAAKCTADLVYEGAMLNHCVGGYTDNVLDGKVIFFIRRAEAPDVPYMTLNLDIKTDKVIQLHGYGNNETAEERAHVMEWVKVWLEKVWLPGKKHRKKTKAA